MTLHFDAIPFFLDRDAVGNVYSLFGGQYSAGSVGVLKCTNEALILEFVTDTNQYSLTTFKQERSDIHTRSIPLSDVLTLEAKRWKTSSNTGDWKHFWNPKLVITTRSLKALEGIPTAQGNTLTLTLELRGLLAARGFAAAVNALIADERLRMIEATNFTTQSLPPKEQASTEQASTEQT
jgi:hypothetical protein